jgi:hypothetical protein
MSFSDLAAVGSFISGIGVLISLIYLGLQVRQNTRAVRSQIHQNIADSWFSVGAMLADHAREFTAGLKTDASTYEGMSDEDKFAFLTCIFAFFKHFENMYLQHKEGFMAADTWNAWTGLMFMYWQMPAVQNWWKARRLTFSPEFRRFIEESPKSAMPLTTDFFGQDEGKSST